MFNPKFGLELPNLQLNSVLLKIGMNAQFNVYNAIFNGIGKNIYIGKVIQKTYLKVDESGTEAAAKAITYNFGAA